jgi:hypothetical protein
MLGYPVKPIGTSFVTQGGDAMPWQMTPASYL